MKWLPRQCRGEIWTPCPVQKTGACRRVIRSHACHCTQSPDLEATIAEWTGVLSPPTRARATQPGDITDQTGIAIAEGQLRLVWLHRARDPTVARRCQSRLPRSQLRRVPGADDEPNLARSNAYVRCGVVRRGQVDNLNAPRCNASV